MIYNDPRRDINTTSRTFPNESVGHNIISATNYLPTTSATKYRNTDDNHPVAYRNTDDNQVGNTVSTDDINPSATQYLPTTSSPPKEKVVS